MVDARYEKVRVRGLVVSQAVLLVAGVTSQGQRKRLNSTNMLEHLMRELNRRSRVVNIFPSEQSLIRLLGSVRIEIDEKWSCESGAYLNPEALRAMEMPS